MLPSYWRENLAKRTDFWGRYSQVWYGFVVKFMSWWRWHGASRRLGIKGIVGMGSDTEYRKIRSLKCAKLPVLEVDKARKVCAHGARATQKDPCFQSPQLTTSYRRYPMVTASAPTTTILPMQALVSSTLATCFCADHLRQKQLGCRGWFFGMCGCG